MISTKQALHLALVATAGAAYLGLGYLATVSEHPPILVLIVGIVPVGAAVLVTAWNSRVRRLSLLLCAACALTIILNLDRLRDHVAWLYFLQHVGAMTILGATFGSTLACGHEGALCSRIASLLSRAHLDLDYLHYTWKVTLAWTVYFVVSAMLSVLLFFFGPIEAWSLFANVLTPLLIGAMFAGEYLIRLRVMPDRTHFNIAETIQAYREYSRRSRIR